MKMLICNDSKVIAAVQSYINRIKNDTKRRYAQAFWDAIYDEGANGKGEYPDTATCGLKYMTVQAVQLRINAIIDENRQVF